MTETIFAVELMDVVKRFPSPEGGDVLAVDHVSLKIEPGEFFSLLGPSGCGKTTSLRMIAGFEWPTQGEVAIMGKTMGKNPPYLRPVNTVFQSYALFQHMTVAKNIAFGLEMDHFPNEEINYRVREVLEMVKLAGLGARKPRQLSGGQQQRVALARALIKRPAVLLLDEPLGALDLKLRKEMQLELKALQEQVGITFIYVTHDQEEALTMSDRIAVMSKGHVLQVGTPVEIYERPNCRFVADFIGETNFLSGEIKTLENNRASVYIPDLDMELEGLALGALRVGQKCYATIRPEKIRLSEQSALGANAFPARVENISYIGSNTQVFIQAGKRLSLRVWEQNKISTLDPRAYYTRGQQLWANLFPENTLILPEEL